MNCELCGDSDSDFVFRGVCGGCVTVLIVRAKKEKTRAAVVPVVDEATNTEENASAE